MAKSVVQKFVCPFAQAEILGRILASLLRTQHIEEIAPILKKHGLFSINVEQWYPMQIVLDIMRDIDESKLNAPEKFVGIGLNVARDFPFPTQADSIPTALTTLNVVIPQVMRNLPDGFGVTVLRLGQRYWRLCADHPFPEDVLYGFIYGIMERFKPAKHVIALYLINDSSIEDRSMRCFDIKWGATPDDIK